VTKRQIRYQNLSRDDHYQLLLRQAHLPEWLARHIVELEELAIHIPERPSSLLPELLGRFPRTMDEFFQEQRMAFMPPLASIETEHRGSLEEVA
jgi:hypothetical protein